MTREAVVASAGGGVERDRLRPRDRAALLQLTRSAVWRELWPIGGFSLALNLLALTSTIYLMGVFDRVLTSGSHETLLFLTLLVAIASVVFGLLSSVRRRLLIRIGHWLEQELGGPALDARADRRLAEGAGAGTEAARALADLKTFFTSEGIVAFLDAPWIPVFLVLIACLHPLLGLFALISTVLLFVCTLVNELLTHKPGEVAVATGQRAQRFAEETLALTEPATAMGMRTNLLRRWHVLQQEAAAAALTVGDRGARLMSVVQFLRMFLQMGIMGLGAWLVLDGRLTSGGMIAASVLLSRALAPIDRSLGAWRSFQAAQAAQRALRLLFQQGPGTTAPLSLPPPRGALAVEGLSFTPPGADAPVLRNIGFLLAAGEALGVIGASGAGKSTLSYLLVGIWRAQRGTVRLDGAVLTQWDDDELGRHLGFLPQFPSLLTATCSENIARMGRPDAEAVIAAARLAGVHEAILQLPQGYDTVIGPQGLRLSGGEQQRVALARALYGDPMLVVLDEPDAHLDAQGLQQLQQVVLQLKARGATVVLISHQVATLRAMDRLLLLRQGEIAAYGSRDDVQAKLAGSRRNVVAMPGQRPAPPEGDASATDRPSDRRDGG